MPATTPIHHDYDCCCEIEDAICARWPDANRILREQTAWASVRAMVAIEGGSPYFPSARCDLHPDQATVADIWDAVMEMIGDPRRAVRWHAEPAEVPA